jgi:hypothetical protein
MAPAPRGPSARDSASAWAAWPPDASAVAGRGHGVSTLEQDAGRADRVAGFLCAFSFVLSAIALVQRPGLLAPAAILIAFVAVRMTEAHRTLAAAAVLVSGLAFFFGMVVAITTDTPLY